MNYSFFNQDTQPRQYVPDSVYTICGEDTQDCNICSNVVWSPVVNGYVHDPQNGKVFCPFGKGNTMNTPIYGDQAFLVKLNPQNFQNTTWGRAPQLSPRPLAKIGLEWRTGG
jgi:hypothetical protein